MKRPNIAYRWTVIPAVTIYLGLVLLWLLVTKRVRSPGFRKLIRARFRKPYEGGLTNIEPDTGHCYIARVPEHLLSDHDLGSSMVVFENGKPLGPAHCAHDDIRQNGAGRFSHYGSNLYFSTTDNSSPLENDREYHVEERRAIQPTSDVPPKPVERRQVS